MGLCNSFHSSDSGPARVTLRSSWYDWRRHNEGRCGPWCPWAPCSIGEGNILLLVLVTIHGASVGRPGTRWHDPTIPPRAGPCLQIVHFVLAPSTSPYTNVSILPIGLSTNADEPQLVRHKGVVEKDCQTCPSHHINEVVMRKVHSRPVENGDIPPGDFAKVGEEMPHKESLESSTSGVERRECTEGDWCAREGFLVPLCTKDRVDPCEATRGAWGAIFGRYKTVDDFVPYKTTVSAMKGVQGYGVNTQGGAHGKVSWMITPNQLR